MKSRHHSINVIRPAIMLLIVAGVIVAMYFSFSAVVRQWVPSLSDNQLVNTSQPAVTTLPTDQVFNQQFIELQQIQPTTYANQALGVAEQYPKPSVPEQLQARATPFGASVIVTWALPLGETVDTIEIYRSTTTEAHDDLLARVSGTMQSYLDLGLADNITYHYSVRAVRQVDGTDYTSNFSKTVPVTSADTVPPAVPTAVTVSRSTSDPSALVIQWEAVTSEPIQQYNLYRSTTAGVLGTKLTHVSAATTTYTDTEIEPAKPYYYTVTAIDFTGNESVSALATAPAGNTDLFVSTAVEAVEKLSNQNLWLWILPLTWLVV